MKENIGFIGFILFVVAFVTFMGILMYSHRRVVVRDYLDTYEIITHTPRRGNHFRVDLRRVRDGRCFFDQSVRKYCRSSKNIKGMKVTLLTTIFKHGSGTDTFIDIHTTGKTMRDACGC